MALAHFGFGSYRRVCGGTLIAVHDPMSMVTTGAVVGGVGGVGWPETAEPSLGADEQEAASSRATRDSSKRIRMVTPMR
jgi:hypothetical protein